MSSLKGGNERFADIDQQILSSAKKVLIQKIEFIDAQFADTEGQKIYSKYKPINSSYSLKHLNSSPAQCQMKQVQNQKSVEKDDMLPVPKLVLFPPEKIEMEWKHPKGIGPGFANLGNTCFLNSVLQALTYTPPLVNFVNSDMHKKTCVSVGFCMLCEFQNHVTRVARHAPQNGPIRPMTIIQKLSYISKNFKFGRQEDAHEFLRYLIEALRKSCLNGKTNIDRLSKETTAINQIFGGFFRSQVTCLLCKKESNTYDPMMELNLDIKEANSIVSALKRTIRTEKLDGENKYFCERCRKKTQALKKGNVHRAPKVLTLQLKRFDFQRLYGGKISKDVSFTETLDLGPFMSSRSGLPVSYKLYAVLVHSGFSCNSGHYYCYVKASNGIWYEMNDSRVSQVGIGTVLRAQAYLLFYAKIEKQTPKVAVQNGPRTPLALQAKTPNTPRVKDIGISIVRTDPKRASLDSDRQKIQFSLSASNKAKVCKTEEEPSTAKPNVKPKMELKTPEKSTSLQNIKKVYDSSSSEESEVAVKKEISSEPKADEKSQIKVETTDKPSLVDEEESKQKEPSQKAEELLSPPKSANTDLLHQKRRVKSVSTPQTASKFGRWFPVKNLNHSFTPRAIYCRSLSDSASFSKHKKSPKPQLEEQMSNEEVASDQTEEATKKKPWMVQEKNETRGVVFGTMTPPPPKSVGVRERTFSTTSETGSVSSTTGEWDVQDKDIPGTPLTPYVPERHFAGWSVERKRINPTLFRSNTTGHSGSENVVGQSSISCDKDSDYSVSKKKSKKKRDKQIEDADCELKSSSSKKRKKRKSSEMKIEEEEEESSAKKHKKSDTDEDSSKKSRKKKKKEKKKKNKIHPESDNEEDTRVKSKSPANGFEKTTRRNSKEATEESSPDRKHKKEKKSKKHKKSKRKSREGSVDDAECLDADVDKHSLCSSSKPPRRVSLTSLGGLEETSTENSKSSYPDRGNSEEKSAKKKKKKEKRRGSSDEEEEEEEERRPLLKQSPAQNGTPKKVIPVKDWDEAPKKMTSWNGSNNTVVVDTLLSRKSLVQTWDGESSSIIGNAAKKDSKRSRDLWDEEYDEGKKKKVKKHHHSRPSFGKSNSNVFQKMQNRRNVEKANGC